MPGVHIHRAAPPGAEARVSANVPAQSFQDLSAATCTQCGPLGSIQVIRSIPLWLRDQQAALIPRLVTTSSLGLPRLCQGQGTRLALNTALAALALGLSSPEAVSDPPPPRCRARLSRWCCCSSSERSAALWKRDPHPAGTGLLNIIHGSARKCPFIRANEGLQGVFSGYGAEQSCSPD